MRRRRDADGIPREVKELVELATMCMWHSRNTAFAAPTMATPDSPLPAHSGVRRVLTHQKGGLRSLFCARHF